MIVVIPKRHHSMIRPVKVCVVAFWAVFSVWSSVCANNLRLTRLELVDEQTLSCRISWDNSWRQTQTPGNHDAVWLFAKASQDNGEWAPLLFSSERNDFHATAPFQIGFSTVEDGLGVFVIPEATGAHDHSELEIELRLATPLTDAAWQIDLMGIEMVWVPEGPYYLGDGSSNFSFGVTSFGPLQVPDESQLNLGPDPGFSSGNSVHPADGLVPAAFPKGPEGFYCMKYELSQEQYADFLNHLTAEQQDARTVSGASSTAGTLALSSGNPFRNTIRVYSPATLNQAAVFGCDAANDGSFNGEEDAQNRACNLLSWDDLAAYLDWAGLSPMTELEFEKACRGPLAPLSDEFAWGTTAAIDANTPVMDGSARETVTETGDAITGLASHGYAGPQGGLRCGFAASAASGRVEAGSTYYGIMEMSGNLWELCVNVGPDGTGFAGSNGDGQLSDSGEANQADWPGATGAGFRGGAWNSGILPGFRDLAVSDRFYSGLAPENRRATAGGRGVRR